MLLLILATARLQKLYAFLLLFIKGLIIKLLMKLRSFALEEDLWQKIRKEAFDENVSCSEIIRRCVRDQMQ